MAIEIQSNVSYLSAPASPIRFSTIDNTMFFYSEPSSPFRILSKRSNSSPKTPKSCPDSDSSSGDFEFDGSRRFVDDLDFETTKFDSDYEQKKQQHYLESHPAMAFADDLFSEGKVLPLNLPPRLQTVSGNVSPAICSPRSPRSGLKFQFSSWRSFGRDELDPFSVALENVKDEKNPMRGRYISQMRDESPKRLKPNENTKRAGQGLIQIGQGPSILVEPKGLEFARRVRLVKLGNNGSEKPSKDAQSGPREKKRAKIKNFLFRSGDDDNKVSFKSLKSARKLEEKELCKVNKMTVIRYKPRLSMCLGLKCVQ